MKKTNILKMILAASVVLFFFPVCKEKAPSYDESDLDVPYVPTPMKVVDEMFRLAELKKGDVLLDLGCGDGRIPVQAALQYGIRAYGVDLNPVRIRESRENAKEAGVEDLVEFRKENIFQSDLTKATVITMYLLPSVNMKLRSRILSEARPGTRIVSHDFNMSEWNSDKDSMIFVDDEAHIVYTWMVPANVTGEWVLKLSDAFLEEIISFNQVFQFAQGKVIPEKKGWKIVEEDLKGDQISFTLLTPDSDWSFKGKVRGDVMSGEAKNKDSEEMTFWEANRDPATKQSLDITAHS